MEAAESSAEFYKSMLPTELLGEDGAAMATTVTLKRVWDKINCLRKYIDLSVDSGKLVYNTIQ